MLDFELLRTFVARLHRAGARDRRADRYRTRRGGLFAALSLRVRTRSGGNSSSSSAAY
jgi:hypothetical protein